MKTGDSVRLAASWKILSTSLFRMFGKNVLT